MCVPVFDTSRRQSCPKRLTPLRTPSRYALGRQRQAHTTEQTQQTVNSNERKRANEPKRTVAPQVKASRKGGGEIRGGAVNPLRSPRIILRRRAFFACFALRYLSCFGYRFRRYFAYECAFVPNSEIFCYDQAIVPFVGNFHFANNVVAVYIAFYEAV